MIPAGSSRSLSARNASSPHLAHLGVHVGGVVAPNRMVVSDRAAGGDDRVARGGLERPPVLELGAGLRRRDEGVVEGRAVAVGVREVAHDDAGRPLRLHRAAQRAAHRVGRARGSATRYATSRASRRSSPGSSAHRAGMDPRSARAPTPCRAPSRAIPRRSIAGSATRSPRRRLDVLGLSLPARDQHAAARPPAHAQVRVERGLLEALHARHRERDARLLGVREARDVRQRVRVRKLPHDLGPRLEVLGHPAPDSASSAAPGARARATSVITPSVPSEPTTTSRSAGPAAVCGVSSVLRVPDGVTISIAVTSSSKRP